MNNDNTFEIEWQNTIQTLTDKNASLKELKYFLDLGRDYSKLYKDSEDVAKVVLTGLSFPDEIIRAMGIECCYVLGGSFESTLYNTVNLPKDADDCARSLVGILKSEELKLSKKDVLLVPLHTDSMKKLKQVVDDLCTVICYEVPSDKNDPVLQKRFAEEIDRVTKELQKHFKKRLSSGKLKEQCKLSKEAAEAFTELEETVKGSVLSDSAFVFVTNSYNWCKDKAEWTKHVKLLTKEIEAANSVKEDSETSTESSKYPEVLFFGSPIYAPDYKVLFVIEEMKLRINTLIHPEIEHIKIAKTADSKSASVKGLALKYLEADISPAFINNHTMIDLVVKALESDEIKGVIAHILKGQIEYDYELKNIERLTIDSKIPMNRIETVYNYQDIEQLRLRLEAFSEILA